MILRRLSEALRKQDWFTVVIETLIVIFGVFIGLQVNNWNAAHEERVREAAYLQRLHEDLEAAEASTLSLGERVASRVIDADRVSDAVYGRDMTITELDKQACESIARLHIFYLEGYALPTLEELIASGQFGLIRDRGLLKSLSGYLSFVRAMPSRADAVSANTPILPHEFSAAISLRSSNRNGDRVRESICDLGAMRADPAFLNAFTEVRERAGFFQENFLAPESALVERIHIELDRALAIDHEVQIVD